MYNLGLFLNAKNNLTKGKILNIKILIVEKRIIETKI